MANPFLIGIMGLLTTVAMIWNSGDSGGDETQGSKVSGYSGGRYGRKDSVAGYGGRGSRYSDHVVNEPDQYDRVEIQPSFSAVSEPKHKTIMIGVRGFRWDFVETIYKQVPRGKSNIQDLAELGLYAKQGIMPVFPTTPVPNLYTLVTGRYPADHGVVADNFMVSRNDVVFVDPNADVFDLAKKQWKDVDSVVGKKIFGARPIWETMGRGKVACMYWPGCEFGSKFDEGHFVKFDPKAKRTWKSRVEQVKKWIGEPSIKLVLIDYRDIIDVARDDGPESDRMNEQLKTFDEEIGQLVRGLGSHVLGKQMSELDNLDVSDVLLQLNLNLIIVGSSGVHEIKSEVAQMEKEAEMVSGVYNTLTKQPTVWLVNSFNGQEDKAKDLLYKKKTDKMKVGIHTASDLRFLKVPYDITDRHPNIVVVAKPGYKLSERRGSDQVEKYGDGYLVGTEYADADSTMRPAFIAYGPAFEQRKIEYDEMGSPNVHFLLCQLLKVELPYSPVLLRQGPEKERNHKFMGTAFKYFRDMDEIDYIRQNRKY